MITYTFPKRFQITNYVPQLRELVDENLMEWYSEKCGGKFHAVLDFGEESMIGLSKEDLIKLRIVIDQIIKKTED